MYNIEAWKKWPIVKALMIHSSSSRILIWRNWKRNGRESSWNWVNGCQRCSEKKLSQFSPETFTGWWVSWRCIKHWSFWRPRHQFHWRGFRQCLCLLRCYQQKLGGNSIVCAKYDILPFKVIYHESKMVKLTAPYIPSFLGFREADILSKMVSTDYLFGWQLKIWSNT